MEPLLALLLTFGLMWVLLIRPQQRRLRQHQAVVASLEIGDEVLTAGGIYGVITSIDEDVLGFEVAPGVVVRVMRGAITQRVGPDTDEEYRSGETNGDTSGDTGGDKGGRGSNELSGEENV